MTTPERLGSVLIVEDEASFREALVMAIGDEGYNVHSASNGAEAIALLEYVKPDIIILDIHMPIMGGPAFLSEYRARHEPAAPVIVCSTRRYDSVISRLDVSAFLIKPVDIDEVLDAIRFNIPERFDPDGREQARSENKAGIRKSRRSSRVRSTSPSTEPSA